MKLSHTNIIGVNFTSERSKAVPSCINCCSSNTTHVVESINLLQQNLRLVKHNTAPHSVWQVPGGELEVGINTNMLQVADGAIQQRTYITKSVQVIQLGKSDYIVNATKWVIYQTCKKLPGSLQSSFVPLQILFT